MLVGPVAARGRALLEGKCTEKGCELLALAIQPDHVHVFVRVWPSDSASDVVKERKRITSFHVRRESPHVLTVPSMWTRSYFASTAGTTIQRYIDAQTGS